MKIKKITVDEGKIPTYDIEVPDVHNYILSSGLVTHNSTIGAGTTNGVYPIRDYDLTKTNETMVINYVVPDSTKLKDKYEIAWEINSTDLIKSYAIMQKWTDQGISVDLYRKLQGSDKVGTSEMIEIYLNLVKYGLKSRYYQNSLTAKGILDEVEDEAECESCAL
jgi:ribonucleoside-diphosphate reductase alpha chain